MSFGTSCHFFWQQPCVLACCSCPGIPCCERFVPECGADTVHFCLQILSFQDVGGSKTSLIKADGTPRKKGKKKTAKKASKGQGDPDDLGESYLASELQDIREDVVGLDAKGEEEGGGEEKRQLPFVTSAPILQSQPYIIIITGNLQSTFGISKCSTTSRKTYNVQIPIIIQISGIQS